MDSDSIPVITIDGPSASGKGTIAQLVARKLAFHYLDSGALYRLVALSAIQSNVDSTNESALADIALNLNVRFHDSSLQLNGEDVTNSIRTEECGNLASIIASQLKVRAALLQRQRAFSPTARPRYRRKRYGYSRISGRDPENFSYSKC